MTAEERIKHLHEKPKPTKEAIKRARRLAIVLALSTCITILMFVYAFIKKTEAEHILEKSVELQQQNETLKLQLEQAQQISMAAKHEAIIQREQAQKALEECANNKK